MEKEVSISVKCPLCSRSLMVDEVLIHNKPAIKLNVETEHERGVLWLSCIYGDSSKEMDINIADGEIVDMYCPHCNKELAISESCSECGAPWYRSSLRPAVWCGFVRAKAVTTITSCSKRLAASCLNFILNTAFEGY